jgi:hypothetical protein
METFVFQQKSGDKQRVKKMEKEFRQNTIPQ